jgi:hypothetical protein
MILLAPSLQRITPSGRWVLWGRPEHTGLTAPAFPRVRLLFIWSEAAG